MQENHHVSNTTDRGTRVTIQQGHRHRKDRLLVRDLIYWINMDADIENTVKNSWTCLAFLEMWWKHKMIPHKIPGKLWEEIGADFLPLTIVIPLCCILSHQIYHRQVSRKALNRKSYLMLQDIFCKTWAPINFRKLQKIPQETDYWTRHIIIIQRSK